jgi:hypothetical protein
MDTAAEENAAPQVRAVATEAIRSLGAFLKSPQSSAIDAAHKRATLDDIDRFLTRPDAPRKRTAPLPTPAGDPIGSSR